MKNFINRLNKMKTKFNIIYKIICILLFIAVMFFINFWLTPSKEVRQKAMTEFVDVMTNSDKIDEIEINYKWEKSIKSVIIKDKKVIHEICMASKINYGEQSVFNGGYSDRYLIRFKFKNKLYSFQYYKNINHFDKCTKQIIKDGTNSYTNPWNDCGQLIILENPDCYKNDVIKECAKKILFLRNFNLIPLLREQVDPLVKMKK